MEYKAFKYYWEKIHKHPKDYTYAFYDPAKKAFVYYACSLIVKNDGSYFFTGPDEALKKWLDNILKKRDGQLEYLYGVTDEKTGDHHTLGKSVGFSEPEFFYAFGEIVSTFGIGKEYYYTGDRASNRGYKKVNSIVDVRKLDDEFDKLKKIKS